MKTFLFICSFILFASFANAQGTILDQIKANNLTTLTLLLELTGLNATLDSPGTFTVFGPSEAAFAALPQAVVNQVVSNPTLATNILLYHVLGAVVLSSALQNDAVVQTAYAGYFIRTNLYNKPGGTIATINGAQVINADISASNGVLHIIDEVLLPENSTILNLVVSDGNLTTLTAALTAASLADVFAGAGPFTVFAPVNSAFDEISNVVTVLLQSENVDLLTKVLTYHVAGSTVYSKGLYSGLELTMLSGDNATVVIGSNGVSVAGKQVIEADINAINGVVHKVAGVLIPPFNTFEYLRVLNNTILVTVLRLTGLNETLSNSATITTIFAPTDAAFAAVPADVLNSLLANTTLLTNVLLYHVVAGEAFSFNLTNDALVNTLAGPPVRTNIYSTTNGPVVTINGARVVAANVDSSNGVIHVIDQVILPPTTTIAGALTGLNLNTLLAAVQAANLTGALSSAGPFTLFAPTDAAFAALPNGTLAALLNDIPTLTSILLYHVVPGTWYSVGLQNTSYNTLNGAAVNVSIGTQVTVNGAAVTGANFNQQNGVIHIIDSVLLPPVTPTESTTGSASSSATTSGASSSTTSGSTSVSTASASTSGGEESSSDGFQVAVLSIFVVLLSLL